VKEAIMGVVAGALDQQPPYEEPPFPVPEEDRFTLLDWLALS